MKDKKRLIVIIGTVILVILIVISLFFLLSKKDNKKDKNVKQDKKERITEQIKHNYDFSKEDAISIVKKIFHSDNYTFEAEVNTDNLYVVTVTNTLTGKKYIYYVDPATKTYRIDESTM